MLPKWHQKGSKMTPGELKMWLWTELGLNTRISPIPAQILASFWEPFRRPWATIWQYSSNKNAPSNEDGILAFLGDFPALPVRPDPAFHTLFTSRNAFPPIQQRHVFLALFCSLLAPFGTPRPPKGRPGTAQNATQKKDV